MNNFIIVNGTNIPYSGNKIHDDEFRSNFMIKTLVLPEHITEIGAYAFFNCWDLREVSMSNNVTRIGDRAFDGCTSLRTINLPKKLKIIECSFSGCEELRSICIPDGVTTIKFCAFYCCTNLTIAEIPNSVTEIGDNAFGGCPHLIIKCKQDSFAHKYAIDNNIKFQLI